MIKIVIAGDFCPRERAAMLIDDHQFSKVFGSVNSIIKSADYAVVNFECPVVINEANPIEKSGPNLKCGPSAVKSIQFAGFNLATLANNHFYDYGEEGVSATLETCEEYGIDTVGGGKNLVEAAKVFYKIVLGKKIAFVNFCEHEFSIASDNSGGSNPLDPVKNYDQIIEARKNADYVIVIVHGGHEHYQLPSLRMKETYRFFIKVGADAVINHHQHCISGFEVFNDKPIFYGLGNFCFDNSKYRNMPWNEGYMVELMLKKDNVSFNLHPYIQCNDSPAILPLKNHDLMNFKSKLSSLNKIIEDVNTLDRYHKKYLCEGNEHLKFAFEPYQGRLFLSLYFRGFLPSFFKKKKIGILSNIECESHRERLLQVLKNLQ